MRYYKKLLGAFLAIALAYTLLLNITFISWYRFSSRETTQHAIDAASRQISEHVDLQLQSLKEMAHMLRISEYTQKYLLEDPENPNRYVRLKLHRFISSIFGVTSSRKNGIAVTKIVDDYVIMHNSTGNLEHALSEFHLNRTQLENVVQEYQEQFGLPIKLVGSMDSQGKKYYTVICREWLGLPRPLYIMVSYTEQQLINVSEIGKDAFAICYNGEPVAVFGAVSQEQVTQWLRDGCPKGWYERRIPSDISGIQYLYYSKSSQSLTHGLLLISLAGLALMIVSFLLMHLLTRRMYSPIADMLLSSNIHISSGNEFSEMRKVFSSLEENVETMSRSLSQYRLSAENKFFHDLFTGLLSPEQIIEQMRALQLPQEMAPFVAVLIKYTVNTEFGMDGSDGLIYELRRHTALALCDSPIGVYRLVDLNFSTQGFIFRTADTTALAEQLRILLLREEPEYGVEITAYIGGVVDRLSDITVSYQWAVRLTEQKEFSRSREKIISQQYRDMLGNASIYYPLGLEQRLINAVVHGRTSIWQSVLKELISANSAPEKYAQLAFMLTATVNRLIDGLNEPAEAFFPEGTIIYLEFRSCASQEELLEKGFFIFSTIEKRLEQEERQSNRGLEQEMVNFIRENYMQDISLLDLAEHLNMSKNYVSTLFKNLIGRNFKEYLNEFRYCTACSLMKNDPDLKIRNVAEKVGCSTDILHRLFLRYGGITPSEYQKQNREKNPPQAR